MTDQIIIEAMKYDAFIGIHESEKQKKQPITIDIKLNYNLKKAGTTDQYSDTICYSAVYQKVVDVINQKQYQLVEHLAETICHHILSDFPITQITIKILKTAAIKNCSGVGVEITRGQGELCVLH
jgi:dihydroneopterin aldolase